MAHTPPLLAALKDAIAKNALESIYRSDGTSSILKRAMMRLLNEDLGLQRWVVHF
jgi:hypothetical protein